MNIKGFDKDLCCRGMQFVVGASYGTGAKDEELELCTDAVFHYCKTLQAVHKFYSVKGDNRFCEIEVLGAEVTDGEKCGSNKIRIIREIVGEELDRMKGLINGNTGIFNSGDRNSGNCNSGNCNSGDWNSGNCNSGDWNSGNCNSGDWNSGNFNSGNCNSGDWNSGNCNSGDFNSGNCNSGDWNSGDWNSGDRNSGDRNSGNCNSGNCNSGDCNSGDWNSGDWNSGNCNSGDRNSGNWNSGGFNSCDYSSGFFCTEEPKARIFNVDTNMTVSEFKNSKYYTAICSAPFILTEWIKYTEEEKAADECKAKTGGYLKTYTYKEACANWWKSLSAENKKIIKSMPNFNAGIFEEITGIETRRE